MPPKRSRRNSEAARASSSLAVRRDPSPGLSVTGHHTSAGSPLAAVRGIRSEPAEPVEGVPWSGTVAVPQAYRKRGSTIPETERRGITLPQLNSLVDLVKRVLERQTLHDSISNAKLKWDKVNLYHINEHFVMPLTSQFKCSFVEVVAVEPQPPLWFVSHWWGTPLAQTHALLHFHAQEREVPPESAYWICTFANNQHDLAELSGDLESTPFVRALLSAECAGTVALLDKQVTTFERIWCVLEHHVSTTQARAQKAEHFFDIAAWLPENSAKFGGNDVPPKATLRVDLGNGHMRECVHDEATGGAFPLAVSAKGAKMNVLEAKASRPEDRRNILHLIAGTPPEQRADAEPPTESTAYDDINVNARRMFASGAMYRAVVQSDSSELARLIEDFPDLINEGIHDGATPLYAAAWKNNTDALGALVTAKADINKQKDDGASPVFVATQCRSNEALNMLLQAGADPSLPRTEDGVAPLFMAAQKAHVDELELLLAAQADVNAHTLKGGSALNIAVQEGHTQVVKALLAGGADPALKNQSGFAAVNIKPKKHHKQIVQLLTNATKTASAEQASADEEDAHPVPPPSSAPNNPPAPAAKAGAKARGRPLARGAEIQQVFGAVGAGLDFYGALDMGMGAASGAPPAPKARGRSTRR